MFSEPNVDENGNYLDEALQVYNSATGLVEPSSKKLESYWFGEAKDYEKRFTVGMEFMMERIYDNNVDKGFYEEPRTFGDCIALMHSELSEALEAHRHGLPPDDKVPEYNNGLVELADCVIRIMDTCQKKGWDLPGAILAKHKYNTTRPYKHGKNY